VTSSAHTEHLTRVVAYYDATLLEYWTFWTGRADLAMHFGYHDGTGRGHSESLLRMNEVLAELAGIRPEDRVLDAGCGYGGSALWLAEHVGCSAAGVTVVPRQVRRARDEALRRGLDSRVTFELADYARTAFPDGSFDVVWGLESVVHAPNKEEFVAEAARLLRPGGRLLISEYMLRDAPPLSAEERAFVEPWLRGWAMPSLLAPGEYEQLMERAGLDLARRHDLTEAVTPSLARLERISSRLLPAGRLLRAVRAMGRTDFANLVGTVRQMEALRRGLWRYVVLVAEKPVPRRRSMTA
jgi:tocopherol O-methyltransferase